MSSTSEMNDSRVSVDETFRILVATDIHLGYAENDPERRDDSFKTFEEILQLAKAHEVDFILLGGDLFHENKPSPYCLHECITLLRQYCLGDKPVQIQFLSDQSKNFEQSTQSVVNYDDPNLNIAIPVFSIHGNHDDPNGFKQLSSLDILSTAGLVNYFGKWTDLTEVKILPILLQKGQSRLALYGLSHIKDERLARLFRDKKVHMYIPEEHANEWFNIFVCHQNRAERGTVKFIPESALPAFLDLVVWGHEHECRISGEKNASQGFEVVQPGSSVATSLCEAEAKAKSVGLLTVCKKRFHMEPIKLQTVRPFLFKELTLSECALPAMDSTTNSVQTYLSDRIELWLGEAALQLTGHPKQPTLPLIRVRVVYNDEAQTFNVIRFGQQFQSRVANATDMIMLKRDKAERKVKDGIFGEEDKANMNEFLRNEEIEDMWDVKLHLLMEKYFEEETTKNLQLFSVKGVSNAAARFIDKSDKESLKTMIDHQMKKVEEHLCRKKVNVDHIDEEIENYRRERMQNSSEETALLNDVISNGIRPPKTEERNMAISDSDASDHGDEEIPATRGRGRARGGRGSRAGQGRGRAIPVTTPRATSSRARGRARGSQSTSLANTSSSTQSRNTRQTTLGNYLRYADSDSDE